MPKSISLKNFLPRLAAVLLLGLFTVASLAEESRSPWKIVIFRTAAPYAVEVEQRLRDGLVKLGYVEGQNLTYLPTVVVKSQIEDFAETAKLVEQKLADKPDLFATIGTQASIPTWKILERTGIPMVFSSVGFPIEGGLITAYGQPTGKNITGISYLSPQQRLEVIRRLFPDTERFRKIAFAYSGQALQDTTYAKHLQVAGSVANWEVIPIDYFDYAQNNTSLRLLINKLQQSNPDLVFGLYSLDLLSNDSQAFKELLDQLRKPLIAMTSKSIDEGAIAGVFTDHQKVGEQQVQMIDRIIKGEKPGDIPPLRPTAYLIELNLKKARELGIQFDQKSIDSASRVVQ